MKKPPKLSEDEVCLVQDCDRPRAVQLYKRGTLVRSRMKYYCQAHEMRVRRFGSPTARMCAEKKCRAVVDDIHEETHIITGSGNVWFCTDCLLEMID